MRRPSPLVLALLGVLALALPAPASAADGDVIAAWASQNPALTATSASLATEMRKGERTRFRRPARIVAAIKQIEKLNAEVQALVGAQTASTPTGGRAREEVLRSVGSFAASLKALRRSIVAASKGRMKAARRLLALSKRKGDAAQAAQSGAVSLFRQAEAEASPTAPPGSPGSQPPPGAPCEDKDPNTAGCQTEAPCQDRDPNVAGCQAQCESDRDPNVGGCQTRCEADQNPKQVGCQTEPPTCAEDPYQSGCPLVCRVDGTRPECQQPPGRRAALRRSALGGLLGFLDAGPDDLGAVVGADL